MTDEAERASADPMAPLTPTTAALIEDGERVRRERNEARAEADRVTAAHARCDSAARNLLGWCDDNLDPDETFNPPSAAQIRELLDGLRTALAARTPVDDKIRSPFTSAQQQALYDWQNDPRVHPFTCDEGHTLVVDRHWYCHECDYTQYWAHAFMADPEARALMAGGGRL